MRMPLGEDLESQVSYQYIVFTKKSQAKMSCLHNELVKH